MWWQAQAQYQDAARATAQAIAYPDQPAGTAPPISQAAMSTLYPSLEEYMGLDLSAAAVQQNMPVVAANPAQVTVLTHLHLTHYFFS